MKALKILHIVTQSSLSQGNIMRAQIKLLSSLVYWELRERSRYSGCQQAGRDRGRSLSPGRKKKFLHVVQTGSVVHAASYTIGTVGFFPRNKVAGA
jgi:hypothetical protein